MLCTKSFRPVSGLLDHARVREVAAGLWCPGWLLNVCVHLKWCASKIVIICGDYADFWECHIGAHSSKQVFFNVFLVMNIKLQIEDWLKGRLAFKNDGAKMVSRSLHPPSPPWPGLTIPAVDNSQCLPTQVLGALMTASQSLGPTKAFPWHTESHLKQVTDCSFGMPMNLFR